MCSPDGVDVLVTVEPADLAVGVPQRDLAAVHDHPGLPPHNGPQPACLGAWDWLVISKSWVAI